MPGNATNFSYSSLDNKVHANWIVTFHNDLKECVHIALRELEYPLDVDQLDFFLYTETMPANGDVAGELVRLVAKLSQQNIQVDPPELDAFAASPEEFNQQASPCKRTESRSTNVGSSFCSALRQMLA